MGKSGRQKLLAEPADWYGEQGLQTISPTKHAIEMFKLALEPEAVS